MLKNETRNITLVEFTVLASSFFVRMRGMIGRQFDSFHAMIFEQTNAIHTCFMKYPIQVIYLDSERHVIRIIQSLLPWRFSTELRASIVIELPHRYLSETSVQCGDLLSYHPTIVW